MRKRERRTGEHGAAAPVDEAPSESAAPTADPETAGSEAAAAASLSAELEKARAREDELLRALAELQNATRRRRQEMETSILYAQESLIRGLLPVLDDIERALEASKDGGGDAFRSGLMMIRERLWRTLEKEGLEVIRPTGDAFDPNVHDAVAQVPAADRPSHSILEVTLPGYRLRGRVLRHAQVVVAGPAQDSAAEEKRP